jgi:hypothetical protein
MIKPKRCLFCGCKYFPLTGGGFGSVYKDGCPAVRIARRVRRNDRKGKQ